MRQTGSTRQRHAEIFVERQEETGGPSRAQRHAGETDLAEEATSPATPVAISFEAADAYERWRIPVERQIAILREGVQRRRVYLSLGRVSIGRQTPPRGPSLGAIPTVALTPRRKSSPRTRQRAPRLRERCRWQCVAALTSPSIPPIGDHLRRWRSHDRLLECTIANSRHPRRSDPDCGGGAADWAETSRSSRSSPALFARDGGRDRRSWYHRSSCAWHALLVWLRVWGGKGSVEAGTDRVERVAIQQPGLTRRGPDQQSLHRAAIATSSARGGACQPFWRK